MKYFLLFLLAFVSLASARTPIDTIAWERSDSGSKYVKIHVPDTNYFREYTVYTRFTPDSIPADTTFELIDSAKGIGSVNIPANPPHVRYLLDMAAFAGANATWVYRLHLDDDTLFTSTFTGVSSQVRNLYFYVDTTRSMIYLTKITRGATSQTAIDSASFTNFGVAHRVRWTLQVSEPARLLGVRGTIQK